MTVNPERKASRASAAAPAILLLIWVSMAILVDPTGDFPLNDDWSFGWTVRTLVIEGRYNPTGWTSMPLLTHVLWGSLFCLPFGFSFTALRLSTLVMGALGVLATYGILREIRGDTRIPFLGALVVAVNPLYFSLSHTFMTDVTFCGFSLLSLLYLVRGLERGRPFELAAGHVLACCAALNRQLGIAIPLAFGAAYLVKNGLRIKNLLRAVLPFFLVLGVLGLYQRWLESTVGLPALYQQGNDALLYSLTHIGEAAQALVERTGISSIYLGLFLLPFLIPFAVRLWHASGGRGKAGMAFGGLAFALASWFALAAFSDGLMPLSGNILYDVGLGPLVLRDTYILGLPNPVRASSWIWIAVTALGIAGAWLLLYLLFAAGVRLVQRVRARESLSSSWPTVLAASCGLLYYLPVALSGIFFDRYLLLLLPLVVLTLSFGLRDVQPAPLHRGRLQNTIVYALVALYSLFSLAATHDYLSWNRARWRALDYLTKDLNVSPGEIDGGFEFNGWYLYDANYERRPDKSWWWVEEDAYILSFGPIAGYQEIEYYPYSRWLPPGNGQVFILRKLVRG